MNPERTDRWGDSRIDAAIADIKSELHDLRGMPEKVALVTDELRAMRDLPAHMAEIAVEFRNLREDVGHCFDSIRDVDKKLTRAEEQRAKREDEQRRERVLDRRWMVGSAISAAALVIAALALILPHP